MAGGISDGLKLLREFLDTEQQEIPYGTALYNFIDSLTTKTIEYNGRYYLTRLEFYQDIPEYEIVEIDFKNKLILNEEK